MASEGVSKAELIRTLHLVRAHHSLAGIAQVAVHFGHLRDAFPALGRCERIPDYGRRLEVLALVASCAADDPWFNGSQLYPHIDTQLRPYSGDSCICDALLIRYRQAAKPEAGRNFDRVVAWFVWQAIRYQFKYVPESEYEQYLIREKVYLIERDDGADIYGAWLALRKLGKADAADQLSKFVALESAFDPDLSVRQAVLFKIATADLDHIRQPFVMLAKRDLGYTDKSLTEAVAPMKGVVPKPVAKFMEAIWKPAPKPAVDRMGALRRRFAGRRSIDSELVRYDGLTAAVSLIEVEGHHAGTVVEYFLADREPSGARKKLIDEDDDPDSGDQSIEPFIGLYLTDQQSHLQAFYASKGVQAAVEYNNAMLPWARWRISGCSNLWNPLHQ